MADKKKKPKKKQSQAKNPKKSTTPKREPKKTITTLTQKRIKRYQDTIKELQSERKRFAKKTDVISKDNVKVIDNTISSLKASIARLTEK